MSEPRQPENVKAQNERSLNTLERAITFSQKKFSLILVRCNYAPLHEQVLEKLGRGSIEIRKIVLPESAKTLYSTIRAELGVEQPTALIVLGLESVTTLDDLLTSTNQVRDEFLNFSFPLVLWSNDAVLQKMVKLAPDFYTWAGVPIKFTCTSDELIKFCRRESAESRGDCADDQPVQNSPLKG